MLRRERPERLLELVPVGDLVERLFGGETLPFRTDVTDAGAITALVDGALEAFGKIDVLVNNAFRPYVFDPENRKLFWETDWSDYQAQIDGALRSTHGLCKAVLPAMKRRARGAIVNVASDLIARPTIPYHDYTTAKAALVGFSRNLAMELGPMGIRVNCVAPGPGNTGFARQAPPDVMDKLISSIPLGRWTTPQDIGQMVAFLASDMSSDIVGQTFSVDGGITMY